jgi:hypothetical protein
MPEMIVSQFPSIKHTGRRKKDKVVSRSHRRRLGNKITTIVLKPDETYDVKCEHGTEVPTESASEALVLARYGIADHCERCRQFSR